MNNVNISLTAVSAVYAGECLSYQFKDERSETEVVGKMTNDLLKTMMNQLELDDSEMYDKLFSVIDNHKVVELNTYGNCHTVEYTVLSEEECLLSLRDTNFSLEDVQVMQLERYETHAEAFSRYIQIITLLTEKHA
mgnify:CR=1 FL=1